MYVFLSKQFPHQHDFSVYPFLDIDVDGGVGARRHWLPWRLR